MVGFNLYTIVVILFSGKIRGAAHSVCNLNYWWRCKKIPFYFHNGSRFDNTLLVPLLQKYPEFKAGKIIASNCEHFKSVSTMTTIVYIRYYVTCSVDRLTMLTLSCEIPFFY